MATEAKGKTFGASFYDDDRTSHHNKKAKKAEIAADCDHALPDNNCKATPTKAGVYAVAQKSAPF